jgi:nucleotide-binding universal stress UspA family protein
MAGKRFLRKILVPVDGSESSRSAQEMAATIAKATQAAVTVMHVEPYSLVYARFRAGYQIPVVIRDEIVSGIEEHATKVINDARDFFVKEGIKVTANRVEFSDVAYSILKYSKGAYELAVMGSRGENEKDKNALGSITKKVVRSSTLPVLIVKKASPSLIKMLVCIDGSQNAINALDFAARLAEKMNSKITLINVQDPRLREISSKTSEELANGILSTATRAIGKKESEIEKRVECGVPQEVIVEVAENGAYDLIVVSSVGLGKTRPFLFGGVSDDVIHKASCSVLVVPPKSR